MKISIVIPARNEEANIQKMVSLLFGSFAKYIDKLIIVNDCSTDSSGTILERLKSKNTKIVVLNRNRNPGVGNAIKSGYKLVPSSSDYVLSLDCDFTKNTKDIKRMIKLAIKSNADMVLGSRYIKGGKLVGYPFVKKIANRTFHLLARIFVGFAHIDVTNNFKLIRVNVLKKITPLLKSRGFSVNAETGLYPIVLGYKVIESPVSWIGRDLDMGKSSFKVVKAGPGYMTVLKQVLEFKKQFKMVKYSSKNEARHFDDLVTQTGETNYANNMPIAEIRFTRKAELINKLLGKRKDVLEIGCGTGVLGGKLTELNKKVNIDSIDISKEAIKVARLRNKKIKYVVGDVLKMAYKGKRFDFVYGNSILHHLPLDLALNEIKRVLKPKGKIVFFEPNLVNPQIFLTKTVPAIKKMMQDSPTETAYNRWSLKKNLEESGFTDVSVTPFDFFHPLIPKFLIKTARKIIPILDQIPVIKEFGGSLIIVADKS